MLSVMPNKKSVATIDGNEGRPYVAYRVNEACCVPSTPSRLLPPWPSWPMSGLPKGIKNIWGNIPDVIEMQSEGGAAGTVHGAPANGFAYHHVYRVAGLMLMLPNIQDRRRTNACCFSCGSPFTRCAGPSIFGDHQDVMAARTTGFAMLSSASVQEAHDFALIAQAASLRSRIPFVHFFDGFRTSHEVNKLELLSDEQIKTMVPR